MTDAVLKIKNLFAIKRAVIDIQTITVLVGPQASGKSIISKSLFFCRGYLDDLLLRQLESRLDRRKFNLDKSNEFYELFPGSDERNREFELEYSEGDFGFHISKGKGSRRLSIKLNDELEATYNRFSSDYKRFVDRVISNTEERDFVDASIDGYSEYREEYSELASKLPETLYVPAARAFFSTLQNNVWRFLSEGGNFDPVLVQFGRAYENYRVRQRVRNRLKDAAFKFDNETQEIIRAKYKRVGTEDFLDTEYGTVNVRHSSSGQQEALPLLFALYQFPLSFYENQMLIVEEPEAHLFPRAQRKIVSLLARVSVVQKCQMFVTSHSPYILACLNNEHKRYAESLSLAAYYVHDGIVDGLYDEELGIIDAGPIDAVSEEIFDEYVNVSDK